MGKLSHFVGDSLGSIAHDFYPDGKSIDLSVFEQNKPVRAEDLTIVEQNTGIKLRDLVGGLVSSGWFTVGPFLFGSVNVGGSPVPFAQNSFAIGESWVNAQGRPVHVGNPANQADAYQNYAIATLAAPPLSGTATDYLYLEVWAQEIAGVGSTDTGGTNIVDRQIFQWGGIANGLATNDIYWADAPDPVEPLRRVQLRWALRSVRGGSFAAAPVQAGAATAQGAYSWTAIEQVTAPSGVGQVVSLYRAGDGSDSAGAALHTTDGYSYMLPVAIVARAAGVTVITNTAVTDARVSVTLNPNIVVNNINIHPGIQVDPAFGHLGTAHFLYEGEAAAQITGDNQTAYHLYQAAYAARFQLQKAHVLAPEGTGSVFGYLRRVTLPLFAVGTGADVTIEIHADGTTIPAGLLASATIPAAWLTALTRDVSFYVNLPNLLDNAFYWLVVKMGGNSSNHAVLQATASVPPSGVGAIAAGDGVTFTTTQIGPFAYKVTTGTAGNPVMALVNAETLYLFEYNPNGTVAALGEYYTPPMGQGAIRSKYSLVSLAADGLTVTDIG